MLVALTGLHASGKSYFAHNIPEKFGFEVVDKKDLVKKICIEETDREDHWTWYQEEYNKDPIAMTTKIIEQLPLNKNIILDAVHSYKEWKIIETLVPNSAIVVVITPETVRSTRWEPGDQQKDKQRIAYWHSDYNGEQGCLLTQVSWAFNGAASLETNIANFKDFMKCYNLEYDLEKAKVKKLTKEV